MGSSRLRFPLNFFIFLIFHNVWFHFKSLELNVVHNSSQALPLKLCSHAISKSLWDLFFPLRFSFSGLRCTCFYFPRADTGGDSWRWQISVDLNPNRKLMKVLTSMSKFKRHGLIKSLRLLQKNQQSTSVHLHCFLWSWQASGSDSDTGLLGCQYKWAELSGAYKSKWARRCLRNKQSMWILRITAFGKSADIYLQSVHIRNCV